MRIVRGRGGNGAVPSASTQHLGQACASQEAALSGASRRIPGGKRVAGGHCIQQSTQQPLCCKEPAKRFLRWLWLPCLLLQP